MEPLVLLLVALLIITFALIFTRYGRAAFDAMVLLVLLLVLLRAL
jgi:hypothetical protein